MPVEVGCGHLMLVRLNSQGAGRQSISLRVERITVIYFHAVAVREEVAIASQHATTIRCALPHATVGSSLHKASERLNGGIGSAGLLRKRRQCCQRTSQKNYCETICSEHLLTPPFFEVGHCRAVGRGNPQPLKAKGQPNPMDQA